MEAEGVLDPAQAEMLRASLAGPGLDPDGQAARARRAPSRRRWPDGVSWGLLGLLGLGLVAALATGGGPAAVQDVTQSLNQPGGHGEMNRTFSTLLAVALLVVVPLLIWTFLHNSLVGKEERVFESWAQTESNFQRRADLIPALVEAVSRYLRHESETLTAVTGARAEADAKLAEAVTGLIEAQKGAAEILREKGAAVVEDEALLRRLYEAQTAVGQGMGGLFAVVEAYPELRSSDQFLELQAQLEGTENRINVARLRFNGAVRDFNATMRMLPWNLVAGLGSFQRKAYFRSEEEARRAPDIQID
jgi:LemA protein